MDLLGLARQALQDAGIPFARLSGIQMNRAPRSKQHLMVLIFTGGVKPAAVLRVSTDSKQAAIFKSSYETLKKLKEALPAHLADSVPEPLLLQNKNGVAIFLESAQRGTPIQMLHPNRYFRSKAFKKDFLAVVDWVVAFNKSLGVTIQDIPSTQRKALLTDPIDAYRRNFRVSPALNRLLDETEEALSNHVLTLVPHHSDFCTANILIDKDHTVRVIDWDHELTPMCPFCDLLHFMSSVWCIRYGRSPAVRQQNYHSLFFTQTHLTSTLQNGVRRYTQSLNLDPGLLTYLSVMTWVHHALYKADFINQVAISEDDAQQLMKTAYPITIVDRDQCLNLEILAAHRDRYIIK